MLRSIVETALRMRVVVVAAALCAMILGWRTVQRAPLDVFPEFAPPLVEIQTEAPGLSTEEVESLVTVPLENALNGTPWLKTIRSKSVLGLSSVVLIFQEGTDLLRARQIVSERLQVEAGKLPVVANKPVMLSPLSSTSRVMKIGITSKKLDQMGMTTLARWTIRPRLMAVPGVANVAIWGQRDRQLQVRVDPERLALRGVTLDQVIKAAGDAVVVGAGGFVDTPNQRLAVRHLAAVETPEDLGRGIVDLRDGVPIRLADVAEVIESHPAPIGDAVIDDVPGLLLIVEKQPWGNTLDVTKKVESAIEALKPGLSDIEIDTTIFRPATFIERSIENLSNALQLGCVLVAAVLLFFLFDLRTAIISLLAIPLSLLTAAMILSGSGATLNVMTIAGLVIAVGEVVDDAIIDVENIARRLRLARASGSTKSAFRIVLDASLEVRSAVVFASLIVVLVFLPVFYLDGLSGSFFRPLASAYVLAILASLVVALTITPALALMVLPSRRGRSEDPPLVRGLKRVYAVLLAPTLRMPGSIALGLALAIGGTIYATRGLKEEFLPSFRETDFLMHWVEKPGTSLDAMRRITERASVELRAIPGVRNFGSHIGRAEVADEVVGPNFTELWISIDPEVPYESTIAKIQSVVDGYPGLYRDLLTYLKERIKEVLTGASGSIVVRLFGEDLELLRSQASAVNATIADIPGLSDLKIEAQVLVPQIQVRLKSDVAASYGLDAEDVRRAAIALVKGVKVGEIYEGQKIFDVTVWGTESVRNDVTAIANLWLDAPNGARVRLSDVAEVYLAPAPNEIKRESASRRLDVTCNVKPNEDLGAIAKEIERRVRTLEFPSGYHPEFLGEYAARTESRNRLFFLSSIALIGILLLLQADFRSWPVATLVFATLPFALIGGVIAAHLSGGVLSLGSLVGFVTVLGIAARNGIMLVSHFQQLEREGMPFGRELVIQGALERLSPILMTALCASLGLVPLVTAGMKPGHEIEYPMAVVILGGLATSTVLNLVLLPSLYLAVRGRVAQPTNDDAVTSLSEV